MRSLFLSWGGKCWGLCCRSLWNCTCAFVCQYVRTLGVRANALLSSSVVTNDTVRERKWVEKGSGYQEGLTARQRSSQHKWWWSHVCKASATHAFEDRIVEYKFALWGHPEVLWTASHFSHVTHTPKTAGSHERRYTVLWYAICYHKRRYAKLCSVIYKNKETARFLCHLLSEKGGIVKQELCTSKRYPSRERVMA